MTNAVGAVQHAAQTVMAGAGHAMVIVFLMFFLLYSGPEASQRIVAMAGTEERRKVVATILHEVNAQLQRFLLVRLVTSVVVAIATWAVLAAMGADNAVTWGVLAGLFNSIPYFGPVIVSGGLFVVGVVQGGAAEGVRMGAAALAVTSIEGWILTPPLMGRAERMNVLSVFLGLLLWTWLWGAWGTLLAVPMLAVVKSVADHVEGLKPLGRLMAA
jgi:predicted PurR-regulated permease PerM